MSRCRSTPRPLGEGTVQLGDEVSIDLESQDASAAVEQGAGEGATPGTDFHDRLVLPRCEGIDERSDHAAIDEEVLTEASSGVREAGRRSHSRRLSDRRFQTSRVPVAGSATRERPEVPPASRPTMGIPRPSRAQTAASTLRCPTELPFVGSPAGWNMVAPPTTLAVSWARRGP